METVKIKSHSIQVVHATNSFNRRAVQFKNKIITALEQLGVARDDIDLELDGNCGKGAKAIVTWYFDGYKLQYETASQERFIDNLGIVLKVIEKEVELVLAGKKEIEEFIAEFAENDDVHDSRKEAREFFGLEHDHKDIQEVDKKYKEMAKTLHPDMPTGDVEKFKKLNHAHKILKRELA